MQADSAAPEIKVPKSEQHYELQLLPLLEEALKRELESAELYRRIGASAEASSEVRAVMELIAKEEDEHAAIVRGRLLECTRRAIVLTWKGVTGKA